MSSKTRTRKTRTTTTTGSTATGFPSGASDGPVEI